MKRLLMTAAVLVALTEVVAAQSAVTAQAAQQLIYRTQMIRDRIGIQCQRLPNKTKCETGVYTTYYGIVDSIRRAERISGEDSGGVDPLKLITQKMDEFDAKTAPDFKILEDSQRPW